ncbi:MAG: organoarsenical effux MFS transporter ArsJ [Rhodobacterales bacterium]
MNLAANKKVYNYVTLAYWVFMFADGALRMLVLLHFHMIGFGAIQIAFLFSLYEVAGVITNLTAGWIGSRFGLSSILYTGIVIQILTISLLSQFGEVSTEVLYLIQIMILQGASGIAKDLVKVSAKSSIKFLSPNQPSKLFKWVSYLTGSKNVIKGLGFFFGALSLGFLTFETILIILVILLIFTLLLTFKSVFFSLSKRKKNIKFSEVFSRNKSINILSLARVFLFGARDTWFVVAVPLYFYSVGIENFFSIDQSGFLFVGGFMALWVIFYGVFQTTAPLIFQTFLNDESYIKKAAFKWSMLAFPIPLILSCVLFLNPNAGIWVISWIILGLFGFGFIFAMNSALHSYLVLALSFNEEAPLDVGFYYMSNSVGRLIGTLLSGILYQLGGVSLCLLITSLMLIGSSLIVRKLSKA